MRHGSSGCSATGATTLPVSPRSCSTRARRSTWRDWRTRTRTGSHGHARWCARGRVAQRWKACVARPMPFQLSAADRVTSVARHRVGTALVPPDDAHHDPLNRNVALVETERRHGGIRGLEPDPASRLPIESLDGGARALHQRDHGLAVVGLVALVDHDEIAVLDVLVDHRLTPHLQHVAAAAAGYQLVGHRDGVVAAHRLDRLAGSAALAPEPRRFAPARAGPTVGVIAEVKRRSPSAGAIREDLDPATHARAYEHGGAVAISVLTDERHFGGTLDDLSRVVRCVSVPVLRKDFILDELQLYEARAAGASAVLLIVRALAPERLRTLADAARGLALGVLVEVHADAELDLALAVEPTALGVNSRDLGTFAVDLGLGERLVARVPAGVPVVAESGIETREDVGRMAAAGADLVLVGTSVARTADPEAAVRELTGVRRQGRGAGPRTGGSHGI